MRKTLVKLERARGAVQRGVDEKFWPSVIKYLTLRGQTNSNSQRDPSEEANETIRKARPTSREAR